MTAIDQKQLGKNLWNNAEQQRIAACLSALDAVLAGQSQKLAALRTHKQALMQQLFPAGESTGEGA